MANEAQASQAHRAELDFDINGLKEKIETLDQGGIHSFGFESGPMYDTNTCVGFLKLSNRS